MSAEIVKLSGAAFCLSPPIGEVLVVGQVRISFSENFYLDSKDKVIHTLSLQWWVIRPLDDRTYYVRSVFTHFGLWRKLYDCSWHSSEPENALSNVLY